MDDKALIEILNSIYEGLDAETQVKISSKINKKVNDIQIDSRFRGEIASISQKILGPRASDVKQLN
jgi:hypothetical protein